MNGYRWLLIWFWMMPVIWAQTPAQAVEVYPALYAMKVKGASVFYHRTVMCPPWTLGVGIRYFDGVRPEEDRPGMLDITAPRNVSLEVQLRYWIIAPFYAVYLTPVIGAHHIGRPYAGLGVGGWIPLWKNLYLTGGAFVKTRSVEQDAAFLVPRYMLGLALLFEQ